MLPGANFLRSNGFILRIGLLTGGVIILFQSISLLVIYRYLKLDYYLCAVALAFLVLGWHLSRREYRATSPSSHLAPTTLPAPNLEPALSAPLFSIAASPAFQSTPASLPALPLAPIPSVPAFSPSAPDWRVLLSSKEMQVLKLLSEGRTNKEIASLQFIEVSTVKTHVNRIYTKLSVSNRKEARVKYAEMAQKWADL